MPRVVRVCHNRDLDLGFNWVPLEPAGPPEVMIRRLPIRIERRWLGERLCTPERVMLLAGIALGLAVYGDD